ncbi:bestrophin family ion channel [Nemorincola caseinilytica]|uniref:Bestrophin family ion channel n=1 Tax=Nemorincola caseinilytica TaxID=2054315 RepID=A0ABP8NLF8_9BACT
MPLIIMINYDNRGLFLNLFVFKKADTLRQLLPAMLVVCAYTGAIVYIETCWLHLTENSPVRNFGVLQTLLGFVISMLLVFRTNTAYDRWWEGRKLWGSLVNNSRNLAAKLNAMLPNSDDKNRAFFRKLIPMFAQALQQHLQAESTRLALDSEPHPEIPDFDQTKHVPNQVASLMITKLTLLYKDGTITGDQLIVLNEEMRSFLDICGACERIKNTPIPYSYSTFIKKFIFMYILTLPIGLVFSLHYLLIPIVALVFYVLASLEMIAEEIEDPFGSDPNDLPMKKMTENIGKNVSDILR